MPQPKMMCVIRYQIDPFQRGERAFALTHEPLSNLFLRQIPAAENHRRIAAIEIARRIHRRRQSLHCKRAHRATRLVLQASFVRAWL